MSVYVLVTGSLFRKAEQRSSNAGRQYVRATLRAAVAENSPAEFWDLLAFGDTAGAELLRLEEGEAVTAQGNLKLELLERDGKPSRIIKTVFVDYALAVRAPRKEKKPKESTVAPPVRRQQLEPVSIIPPAAAPPFDDDIPF
jgi:hypothetical protein